MEARYQNLIEEVSEVVTNTLFDDAEWLEENHRLELDELMFQLMMLISLATLTKLFTRLCQRRVEFCRTEGMCVWSWGDPITVSTRVGSVEVLSPYMRNAETGESARPMKRMFGLRGKGKSLALERALSDFGSEDSYGEAERARLKLPGACWKIESINPMMAIRVIKKNGWWDDFWQWRLEQKKAA